MKTIIDRSSLKMELELCDFKTGQQKCTDCFNDWRYLCRSQRYCDFGSGDDEYDNPGLLWSCCCWCLSCCLLCPSALCSTVLVCLYFVYRTCRACLIVLSCGICYLYANQGKCKCTTCISEARSEKSTAAEGIVWKLDTEHSATTGTPIIFIMARSGLVPLRRTAHACYSTLNNKGFLHHFMDRYEKFTIIRPYQNAVTLL